MRDILGLLLSIVIILDIVINHVSNYWSARARISTPVRPQIFILASFTRMYRSLVSPKIWQIIVTSNSSANDNYIWHTRSPHTN